MLYRFFFPQPQEVSNLDHLHFFISPVNSVQAYRERGWDYITELHKFVRNGMQDGDSFINAVSGIVNRGCHDPVSPVLHFFTFFSAGCSFSFSTLIVFVAAMWNRPSGWFE